MVITGGDTMTQDERIKSTLCELIHINGGWHCDDLSITGWAAFRCGINLTSRTAQAYQFDEYTITNEDYDQWVKQKD